MSDPHDVLPAPRPASGRPLSVDRAITLMWFSWFISFPLWALGAERSPQDGNWLGTLLSAAMLLWVAWLIRRLGQRSKPARLALLMLTLLGWLLMLNPAEGEPAPGVLEASLNAFDIVICVLALWWLFTGAGAAWFAASDSAKS